MSDIHAVLKRALILNPPVSFGSEVRDWDALLHLVNAVPEIQTRLTLLEESLTEISKMTGCEVEAASEFAEAVLERSLTYEEWVSELQSESQKKPSA